MPAALSQEERKYRPMDQKKFSLNIREKLLQSLYDMVNNDELCDEMQKAFSNLDEFVTGIHDRSEYDT